MRPRSRPSGTAKTSSLPTARGLFLKPQLRRSGMSKLPQLVAFDLDATLWYPEMYMLSGAPFRRDSSGAVHDRRGEEVELMGNSRTVLKELATDPKWRDTEVAYVSRTDCHDWAVTCLKLFQVADNLSMFDVARYQEIYPGSKIKHFKKVSKDSGIAYEDMLFFDNEWWNIQEVSRLGVTCIFTPDGMTDKAWVDGLKQHAAKKK